MRRYGILSLIAIGLAAVLSWPATGRSAAAASFVLDVASARPPEHFARVMEEAVPRVDRR